MELETLPTDKATLETVIQVHRWTENLFSFKTTKPDGYRFTPGQYARLGLSGSNGIIWRAYSIVSSPDEDSLEYYGVIVPGGIFTSLLKNTSPGDNVWIERQSYGFMTVDRFTGGEEFWMFATGTGLGPFISILRDAMVWEKFQRLILVHCVRHTEEFAYRGELLALQNNPRPDSSAKLHVIRSTTREAGSQPGCLQGRITSLLESGELEKAVGIPMSVDTSRIMLCGNPAMIEETRRILHQRGFKPCRRLLPGQFVTENYW